MNLRRTIALACLTASAPVFAAETYHIHIEPQPLTTALQQFATQSGLQIIYFGQITDAYSADAVVGNLSAVEILNRLLAGTDLTYEALDRDTIAITDSRTQSGSSTQGAIKNVESIRLAQNDAPSERFEGTPHGGQTEEHAASTMRSASSDVGLTSLEEVVVLGTSIKGVAPAGSPVLIYGREEIESTGSATVAQFIERLPQNFGNINSASLDNSVPNIGRGTGVNLRGIGSRTTLTLVNGRRMALVGMGQMTDISLIPVGAIERIEVLPDGASAIYGSDAVAGVVNIVLRKDYAGAESHVRAESRLNGNSMLYVADQALGTAWSSGSGTFSFGYQRDEPIQAADRDYMNAGAVHEITPK